MTLPFWKMHGAGNDFILFDDRAQIVPATDHAWLSRIGARRTGIGCEGIILIQSAREADFRMRFINPNGFPAEMCGNGARCAARLAFELGVAPATMTIATDAGTVHARVDDTSVTLTLPAPTAIEPYADIEVDGYPPLSYGTANTSVPHVILEVPEIDDTPVATLGAALRYHPRFAPDGTNVNFVQRIDESHLAIRTYERGVEGETGACGTGATAAAIIMALRGQVATPVTVTTLVGDRLQINFDSTGNSVQNPTLTGPALHVYQGSIEGPA